MHRNTLLLLTFLAVIASFLIGLSAGRNIPATRTPSPSQPTPTPTLSLATGSTCGVSFQYPNVLTAMESSESGTILVNATNPDDSIVILCQKNIPRIPLSPDATKTVPIGSISATLYHDASAKDGAPIDKLIFTHPKTKLDVFIAGFGPVFRDLIASLELL